jgi:hypothetical protein
MISDLYSLLTNLATLALAIENLLRAFFSWTGYRPGRLVGAEMNSVA